MRRLTLSYCSLHGVWLALREICTVHFFHETDAPRAQDATVAVQHQRRTEIHVGFHALAVAEQAGVIKLKRAILGNLGNLFYELGDFERATAYFEKALGAPPGTGSTTWALLESVARIHLILGRNDHCLAVLDRIEADAPTELDRLSYEIRYAAHTRIHLLARLGQTNRALSKSDDLLELVARAGDGIRHAGTAGKDGTQKKT